MFEFDQHYIELDLLEHEEQSFMIEDNTELAAEWLYLGYAVWKMDFALVPLEQRDQQAS